MFANTVMKKPKFFKWDKLTGAYRVCEIVRAVTRQPCVHKEYGNCEPLLEEEIRFSVYAIAGYITPGRNIYVANMAIDVRPLPSRPSIEHIPPDVIGGVDIVRS